MPDNRITEAFGVTLPPVDRSATIGGGYEADAFGTYYAATATGATAAINASNGLFQRITLTQPITTLSFSNFTAGQSLHLELVQDATGGRYVTWPSGVTWPLLAAPALNQAANAIDSFNLFTPDGTAFYAPGQGGAWAGVDPTTIPNCTHYWDALSQAFNDAPNLPALASREGAAWSLTAAGTPPTGIIPTAFRRGGRGIGQGGPVHSGQILSSTNATPIVVTTEAPHGLFSGQVVHIRNHATNTNANTVPPAVGWTVIVTGATTYSLTGSVGNGVGANTGQWYMDPNPGLNSGTPYGPFDPERCYLDYTPYSGGGAGQGSVLSPTGLALANWTVVFAFQAEDRTGIASVYVNAGANRFQFQPLNGANLQLQGSDGATANNLAFGSAAVQLGPNAHVVAIKYDGVTATAYWENGNGVIQSQVVNGLHASGSLDKVELNATGFSPFIGHNKFPACAIFNSALDFSAANQPGQLAMRWIGKLAGVTV